MSLGQIDLLHVLHLTVFLQTVPGHLLSPHVASPTVLNPSEMLVSTDLVVLGAGRPMQPDSIGLKLYAEIYFRANNIFLAIINKIQDVGA
jgi:hypothetical protein